MSTLPKKRPPTKTTRHGNGAGWGGSAKGASVAPASIQTAPPVDGVQSNPGNQPGYRTLGKRAAHEALKEKIFARAMDDREPLVGVVRAFEALSLRDLGAVQQKHDHTVRNLPASAADDAALAAIALAGSGDAATSEDVPDEPGDLVH